MSFVFTARSHALERMDVETFSPDCTSKIFKTLETINAWLGGVRATLWHLDRFSQRWEPGQRIRIVDWGTGGADMPRAIVRWGRARRFKIEIVGVDNNSETAAYARKACGGYPEIRIVQEDAIQSPSSAPSVPFDYAISSLCLHHLSDAEVVVLLKKSDQLTARGIIMNDLKRSARAWAWIWALSRLGGAHPVVQNDGPLSVKRAFTVHELEKLALAARVGYAKVFTHFGYRLTLAGEKI